MRSQQKSPELSGQYFSYPICICSEVGLRILFDGRGNAGSNRILMNITGSEDAGADRSACFISISSEQFSGYEGCISSLLERVSLLYVLL